MAAAPLPSYLIQTRTSYLPQDTVRFFIMTEGPNPNTGLMQEQRVDLTGTIIALKQTTTVQLVNGAYRHVAVVKYKIQYIGPDGHGSENVSASQITALIHRPVHGPTSGYILS